MRSTEWHHDELDLGTWMEERLGLFKQKKVRARDPRCTEPRCRSPNQEVPSRFSLWKYSGSMPAVAAAPVGRERDVPVRLEGLPDLPVNHFAFVEALRGRLVAVSGRIALLGHERGGRLRGPA
jgi:hypothetical protein